MKNIWKRIKKEAAFLITLTIVVGIIPPSVFLYYNHSERQWERQQQVQKQQAQRVLQEKEAHIKEACGSDINVEDFQNAFKNKDYVYLSKYISSQQGIIFKIDWETREIYYSKDDFNHLLQIDDKKLMGLLDEIYGLVNSHTYLNYDNSATLCHITYAYSDNTWGRSIKIEFRNIENKWYLTRVDHSSYTF